MGRIPKNRKWLARKMENAYGNAGELAVKMDETWKLHSARTQSLRDLRVLQSAGMFNGDGGDPKALLILDPPITIPVWDRNGKAYRVPTSLREINEHVLRKCGRSASALVEGIWENKALVSADGRLKEFLPPKLNALPPKDETSA